MRRLRCVLGLATVVLAGACGAAEEAPPASDRFESQSGMANTPSTVKPHDNPCAEGVEKRAAVVAIGPDGRRRWSAPLRNNGSPGTIGPLVHGDVVFTTEGGELRAFDVRTGAQHWRKDVGGPVYGVWMSDGLLVALVDQVSVQGRVLGLEPATGEARWEYKTAGGGVLGEPLLTPDGALAMVNAREGSLVVLDLNTGKVRWSVPGPDSVYIAVAPGTVLRNADGRHTAYDSMTGKVRWSVEAGDDLRPGVVDGVVVAASGVVPNAAPFAGYALADGRRLWTSSIRFDQAGVFLLPPSAGVLVDADMGAANQTLALLDAKTGNVRWEVEANVYFGDAPVVAGEYLVAGEAVPGGGGAALVVRRLSDGSVKERLEGAAGKGSGLAGMASFVGLMGAHGGEAVLVRGGAVAWRAPLEMVAQRAPTPTADGGAVVQIADPMCATAVRGG